MQEIFRKKEFYKISASTMASIVLAFGLLFCFGHIFHANFLLSLPPATWPITWPIALSILISGIALLFQFWKFPLVNLLGVCIVSIVAIFHAMIPIGGIVGFFLVGMLFIFRFYKHRSVFKTGVLFVTALFIFFIGFGGVILYFLPITVAIGLQQAPVIHFYTRVCLVFISLSMISGTIYIDIKDRIFYWDITAVRHALLPQFSEKLTVALSQSHSISEAMQKIFTIFQEFYGWQVLFFCQRRKREEGFQCMEVIHEPHIKLPPCDQMLSTKVIQSGKYIFYVDIGKSEALNSLEREKYASFKGCFAFPIYDQDRIEGVIELYKQTKFEEGIDDVICDIIKSIGITIGAFLKKMAADVLNAQLLQIVTYSLDAIYSCDLDGNILSWNRGAEKIFGWQLEEIIGKNCLMLYPKDEQANFIHVLQELKGKKYIDHFETRALQRNGSLIWVNQMYSMIHDQEGQDIGISSVIQDITQSKEMRRRLEESESRFRSIVEATIAWVWEMDASYKFTYSNPSVEEILGYKPAEIVGVNLFFLVREEDNKELRKEVETCSKNKKGWSRKIIVWKHKNGSEKILESNASSILNEEGEFIGFRGADRDITERKQLERLQDEFISMVSHELRTPLTSIYGALGILKQEKILSDKGQDLVNIAYRNSERLTHIINDILDIERLEGGKFNFDKKPTILADLIEEAVKLVAPMAKKFDIELVIKDLLKDVQVNVDKERIIQVINNLLSNAIKFSYPKGKVTISMQLKGDHVRVLVEDHGKGIPEYFKPKVFERFTQFETHDARTQNGTGLGLSICLAIIERLGGSIGFESEENVGSLFYFDLPRLK